jgi:hypothetical protein
MSHFRLGYVPVDLACKGGVNGERRGEKAMSELRAWEIPMLDGTELSDVEVIRVLEVRPRIQREEPVEAGASRPVVRELAQPMRAASVVAPKPVHAPAPVAASASAPATKPGLAITPAAAAKPVSPATPREERDTLADTLNELRKFAFDLESDDTGSTSRVRHLQVELDEPASSKKSRGSRR